MHIQPTWLSAQGTLQSDSSMLYCNWTSFSSTIAVPTFFIFPCTRTFRGVYNGIYAMENTVNSKGFTSLALNRGLHTSGWREVKNHCWKRNSWSSWYLTCDRHHKSFVKLMQEGEKNSMFQSWELIWRVNCKIGRVSDSRHSKQNAYFVVET